VIERAPRPFGRLCKLREAFPRTTPEPPIASIVSLHHDKGILGPFHPDFAAA
jgi:hypothetical protein